MDEDLALKNLARTAEMLALCLKHEPSRVYALGEELHEAYRTWFSAWQSRIQDR